MRDDKIDGIAAEKGHHVSKKSNCRDTQGMQLMIRDRYDTRGGDFYGHAPHKVKHASISHASGEQKKVPSPSNTMGSSWAHSTGHTICKHSATCPNRLGEAQRSSTASLPLTRTDQDSGTLLLGVTANQ